MARPRKSAKGDTRGRILKAAIVEFARHGYDAAGVDRIARRARVNKALIYYYFANKRCLYHEILQGSLQGLVALLSEVVDGPGDASAKLARYIDTLVAQLDSHPHLPRIMLRELADSGRHLDVQTLRQLVTLPPLLFRLVGQGRAEGAFGPFDPLMLRQMRNPFVAQEHVAGGRRVDARQQVDECRLARAVGTDQRVARSRRQREADLAVGLESAPVLR